MYNYQGNNNGSVYEGSNLYDDPYSSMYGSGSNSPYLNPGAYNSGVSQQPDMSSVYQGYASSFPMQPQSNLTPQNFQTVNYARGGMIGYPPPNPLRALALKNAGVPKYGKGGLFGKPGKWIASNIGPAVGATIGNMILPGVGGVIGGAIGGAAGSKVRGRNDYLQAGARGAAIGAMLPSGASIVGSGANAVGATSTGQYLSDYGTKNAILPSLNSLLGTNLSATGATSAGSAASAAMPFMAGGGQGGNAPYPNPYAQAYPYQYPPSPYPPYPYPPAPAAPQSFTDKLKDGTADFFAKPTNWLAGLSAASSLMAKKPKEKSPEQLASEAKRYELNRMLTPHEVAQREGNMLALEQSNRRIERGKFLPEEKIDIAPIYSKTSTPEEYKKTKKWINYYDNPQFRGTPINFSHGGYTGRQERSGLFLDGDTKGQDDLVPAVISDGLRHQEARLADSEYVVPADVIADLGDGNAKAGAKVMRRLEDIIRQDKRGTSKFPNKSKPIEVYLREALKTKRKAA